MEIRIYSATKLTEPDIEAVRFIMAQSQNRDRDLANRFPQRFKRREGNKVYFDLGKRRYLERVKINKDGDAK